MNKFIREDKPFPKIINGVSKTFTNLVFNRILKVVIDIVLINMI